MAARCREVSHTAPGHHNTLHFKDDEGAPHLQARRALHDKGYVRFEDFCAARDSGRAPAALARLPPTPRSRHHGQPSPHSRPPPPRARTSHSSHRSRQLGLTPDLPQKRRSVSREPGTPHAATAPLRPADLNTRGGAAATDPGPKARYAAAGDATAYHATPSRGGASAYAPAAPSSTSSTGSLVTPRALRALPSPAAVRPLSPVPPSPRDASPQLAAAALPPSAQGGDLAAHGRLRDPTSGAHTGRDDTAAAHASGGHSGRESAAAQQGGGAAPAPARASEQLAAGAAAQSAPANIVIPDAAEQRARDAGSATQGAAAAPGEAAGASLGGGEGGAPLSARSEAQLSARGMSSSSVMEDMLLQQVASMGQVRRCSAALCLR